MLSPQIQTVSGDKTLLYESCDSADITYLTGDFGAVDQGGGVACSISALSCILVHIFLVGLEPGCHCSTVMMNI